MYDKMGNLLNCLNLEISTNVFEKRREKRARNSERARERERARESERARERTRERRRRTKRIGLKSNKPK